MVFEMKQVFYTMHDGTVLTGQNQWERRKVLIHQEPQPINQLAAKMTELPSGKPSLSLTYTHMYTCTHACTFLRKACSTHSATEMQAIPSEPLVKCLWEGTAKL